mmetsp:Transcript_19358/g.30721  ORF Transcript_19358/g.30721 Transcript_19358/m.30721 type:complete len:260 (+) Transcript_19358:393-1172(+)
MHKLPDLLLPQTSNRRNVIAVQLLGASFKQEGLRRGEQQWQSRSAVKLDRGFTAVAVVLAVKGQMQDFRLFPERVSEQRHGQTVALNHFVVLSHRFHLGICLQRRVVLDAVVYDGRGGRGCRGRHRSQEWSVCLELDDPAVVVVLVVAVHVVVVFHVAQEVIEFRGRDRVVGEQRFHRVIFRGVSKRIVQANAGLLARVVHVAAARRVVYMLLIMTARACQRRRYVVRAMRRKLAVVDHHHAVLVAFAARSRGSCCHCY